VVAKRVQLLKELVPALCGIGSWAPGV